MSKKNVGIAVFLGVFGLGGFYAAGFKKGLLLFVALSLIMWVIINFISPDIAIIGNVASAYISYKWAKDHNAVLPDGGTQA